MNLEVLQNIGLTRIEASIYICLLEFGTKSISSISEISKCNRMQIYASIPRMMELGIIGQTIQGKRKLFFAKSPDKLEGIFQEKQREFQNTIELLKKNYTQTKEQPELITAHGISGIQSIFDDILESLEIGDTFYRYSGRKHNTNKEILKKDYRIKRDAKKLERLVITNSELEKQKEKKNERQIVCIPKKYDLFEDNVSKIIYKDKVAIIDYNTMSSFVIKNQKFADFEKKIFKLLFKYLRTN